MYCKNCGKDLPDNARFCDKCNMSVRKKERKMDLIEELKEERLARQKAHEIEARLKKIRRVKRKRYRAVALIILAVVLVWGGVIIWTYIQESAKSTITNDRAEYNTPTVAPTAVPTEKPVEPLYKNETVEGIAIEYPKSFAKEENADCVASYSDGVATIKITRAVAAEAPNDLVIAYVESIPNAEVDNNELFANNDGYKITFTAGTKRYHKKCIVKDGEAISYELVYPKEESQKYEEYIETMDIGFTVS